MTRSDFLQAVIDTNIEMIKACLKQGSDVNENDAHGWTALHFAAQNNSVSVGSLLIEAGADIEATDHNGNTPLWRATFASQGNCAFIELLLAAGADPNTDNHFGVSPISLAKLIDNYPVYQCYDETGSNTD